MLNGPQGEALIFGSMGQDAQYLAELIRQRGISVVGVSRSGGDCVGSIVDMEYVDYLLKSNRPNFIFHLAADSSTRHEAVRANHDAIGTGTLNILESARTHCPAARIFITGSALQFKNKGVPIDETDEFEASSAYSVARIHSTYLARYYRSAFGMNVYCGYLFNHDSPRRSARHINKAIVDAALRIAAGSRETVKIGDPGVRKEFGFAGDIVQAMWRLVNQDTVHEAVIGTGIAYSIHDWAEACFRCVGLDLDGHLETDHEFRAPYQVLVSDPSVIRSLGWSPAVGFEELAGMMMGST